MSISNLWPVMAQLATLVGAVHKERHAQEEGGV